MCFAVSCFVLLHTAPLLQWGVVAGACFEAIERVGIFCLLFARNDVPLGHCFGVAEAIKRLGISYDSRLL